MARCLPPKHILNAPTKLMKTEGYGSGYEYDHDAAEAFSGQDYFPEQLGRQKFYDPPERGFEREIRKRLEYWAKAAQRTERQVRGSRGPRQPGGGKQIAGSRQQRRFARRHPDAAKGPPAVRGAKGKRKPPIKSADADLSFEKPKPGRSNFGRGGGHVARATSFEARRSLSSGRPKAAPGGRPPQDDAKQNDVPPTAMPTSVQNVTVTADENGMRVDRFFEARFPGLSFSHIQRVIRKGEVRVNGKRTQPKNRLEAGQTVRIPPLRLDAPKPENAGSEADEKTRAFLKSITLYEDADVLVLNKPMGLAVQGGSGTTRHLDGMLEVLRDAHGQRPRLVHRLDKDTAGCLLVAKTRFAASALAKTFRSRSARRSIGRWSRACPRFSRAASRPFSPKKSAKMSCSCALRVTAIKGRVTR